MGECYVRFLRKCSAKKTLKKYKMLIGLIKNSTIHRIAIMIIFQYILSIVYTHKKRGEKSTVFFSLTKLHKVQLRWEQVFLVNHYYS